MRMLVSWRHVQRSQPSGPSRGCDDVGAGAHSDTWNPLTSSLCSQRVEVLPDPGDHEQADEHEHDAADHLDRALVAAQPPRGPAGPVEPGRDEEEGQAEPQAVGRREHDAAPDLRVHAWRWP